MLEFLQGWRCKWRRTTISAGRALILGLAAGLFAQSAQAAVVVMYHRFGESGLPSTNIGIEQFEAHLRELAEGDYTVAPLETIARAASRGEALPDRTVGISVDDAFLSAYREAWPRLKAADIPWTLFVATQSIDQGRAGYMSWDQIRELADSGVTIGSQTATHLHMPLAGGEENRSELDRSNARFAAELGAKPTLFAYPYGEASGAAMATVREAGFIAAFGQHSGAIGTSAERYFLPRFAMNESYGDIDRFRLAVNALPLEVTAVTPEDALLGPENNPPAIGFTVLREIPGLRLLACYASHEGKVQTENLGGVRIEVRPSTPFPEGRGRINCTVPADGSRWYWYGRQFFVP